MKKGLRSTALALTAVLAVTGLSACGGKGDPKEATTAKSAEADFSYTGAAPVTKTPGAKVSILAQNSWYSTVDYANADIVKKIQENAGVTIDWTLVSPVNYKDSVSPMLASGTDLPNIVQLPDLDNNMTYITAGLFYPLDEYLDYMPNYKKYLDENPGTILVLSGAQGMDEPVSEALAMKEYLVFNGVKEEQLILETRSYSTVENIAYSRVAIEEDQERKKAKSQESPIIMVPGTYVEVPDKPIKIGVLTSDFHVFRAQQIAKKWGIPDIYSISCDSDPVLFIHFCVRECAAILKDKLVGNM